MLHMKLKIHGCSVLKVGSCPEDDHSVQFHFLSFSVQYLNNFIS